MPHAIGLAVLGHSFIHLFTFHGSLTRLQNHMDIEIVNRQYNYMIIAMIYMG
jgi:hypothetical protein